MNNETEQVFIINIPADQSAELGVHGAGTNGLGVNNVNKMSNICRTCATVTEMVVPIFDGEGLQNNLADKIHKYLPIQVSKQDILPRVVCYQCVSTLLAFHELVMCCAQVDAALRSQLLTADVTDQVQTEQMIQDVQKSSTDEAGPSEDKEQNKFQPRLVNFGSLRIANLRCDFDYSDGLEIIAEQNESISEDDDQPLSKLAIDKSELFNKFYKALVNFRNHYGNEHATKKCNYPEFTDTSKSSDSEAVDEDAVGGEVDINSFDDLTDYNMRKGRMDDETREELTQVQKKVNGKVFYVCKICGKELSSAHTYLFHQRIHTDERPCVCHICGKQFRTPNGLHRHLTSTHERLRRHSCRFCSKTFANAQNLRQHFRIHTGEQPYVCSHCGKRFTQSGSLHAHLKTHADNFPYQCAECGAKFRLKSGLSRHSLKHTGERPHVCHCGKAYRQKHELNSHTLIHTDSKPHPCTICGATFRHRRALRHHSKRVHNLEPPLVFSHLNVLPALPFQS